MDGSNLATPFERYSTGAMVAALPPQPTFACQLKDFRQRFGFKQLWLANVVGCTDAAVSFWETGKRLPQAHIIVIMVDVLRKMGATPKELMVLYTSWREEKRRAALASALAPRRRKLTGLVGGP
jgi:DNA-binding XRE family transcriptional regulator